MINCVVDIGNTRIKVALFEDDKIIDVKTVIKPSELESVLLPNRIENTIISSVANEELTKFVISLFHKPLLLDGDTLLPIRNSYKTPQTLGKDRLANAVGAYHLFNDNNCLIIDAGTCLKIDLLTSENEYIGGTISPGLLMRFKALNTFTDKLPLVNPNESEPVNLGVDTLTSIHSGCYMGMNNEIEATISHFQKNYDNLKIILTGGDMEELQKMEFSQKNSIFADRWLTLRGLNEILSYNVKS